MPEQQPPLPPPPPPPPPPDPTPPPPPAPAYTAPQPQAYQQPPAPAYQQPAQQPYGQQPAYPAAQPAYGPPRPPKKRKGCWFWGCLIGAIVLIIGGGIACCIGGPLAMVRQPGLMAGAWLQNVSTGNVEAAAGMTEGGQSKCEDLVKKLEREVGDLKPASGQEIFTKADVDKAKGAATADIPVSGDDGTVTATFHLKAQQMGFMKTWLVEDITFEDTDRDRDRDRDEESGGDEGSGVRGNR